jgi:hypothetical protein
MQERRGKRRILKCRIPWVTSAKLKPIFSVTTVLEEACSTGNSEEEKDAQNFAGQGN